MAVAPVDRSAAAAGRWVVDARINPEPGSSAPFSLRRVYQLEPAPPALPRKVLINDTLTSHAAATIGLHVRHHATLAAGARVDSAAVPGRFDPGTCGTEANTGIFGDPFHPSNFGRPDIFMNTSSGAGLGLVALDDVFRVHGEAWNSGRTPILSPSKRDPMLTPRVRLMQQPRA